jgi:hypothetical protein
MRSFITLLLAKYNQKDQDKEDEIARACSTNVAKRKPCRILLVKPEETTMQTKK